jgi:hypothetical protein
MPKELPPKNRSESMPGKAQAHNPDSHSQLRVEEFSREGIKRHLEQLIKEQTLGPEKIEKLYYANLDHRKKLIKGLWEDPNNKQAQERASRGISRESKRFSVSMSRNIFRLIRGNRGRHSKPFEFDTSEISFLASQLGSDLMTVRTPAGMNTGTLQHLIDNATQHANKLWGESPHTSWNAIEATRHFLHAVGVAPDPHRSNRQLIVDVIRLLGQLVSADLIAAFSVDRSLNRMCVLELGDDPSVPVIGARYPQAFCGISNLSKDILNGVKAQFDLEIDTDLLGTLMFREKIQHIRFVPLCWTGGEICILFAWRDRAPTWSKTIDSKQSVIENWTMVKPMVLSALGWLEQHQIQLTDRRAVLKSKNIRMTLLDLTGIFSHVILHPDDQEKLARAKELDRRGELLKWAARHLLAIDENRIASIHTHRIIRENERQSKDGIVPECAFPGRDDADHGERLRFVEAPHIIGGEEFVGQPEHSLLLDSKGLVERSLSAQASSWRTPIFLQDLAREYKYFEEGVIRGQLATMSIPCSEGFSPRKDINTCELAVPIPSSSFACRCSGVIDIELKSDEVIRNELEIDPASVPGTSRLEREHVIAVQMLTHLFSSLELLADQFAAAEGNAKSLLKKQIHVIVNTLKNQPKDIDELWLGLCRNVNKILGATVASVMIHSSDYDTLMPRACYFPTLPDANVTSGDALDSMYRHLIPRKHGLSSEVYTTAHAQAYWNVEDGKDKINPRMHQYGSIACLPLIAYDEMQPDGVITVAWDNAPAHLVDDHSNIDVSDKLLCQIDTRVGILLRVYAGIFSLYQLTGQQARC